jgi:TRAP-type mannitol/chloroaromatic compound transport system permease small subunit
MLERAERFIRCFGTVVACVLIPAQIITSLAYLTGRRIIQFSTTPLQELEWHLFFALVFLSFGSVLLADRHVRIDVFRERMSPKTRSYIEIFGFIIALVPFSLALIYFGSAFSWRAFLIDEGSRAALGLPHRWIIKAMMPLGGFLLLFAGAIITKRNISLVLEIRRAKEV